MSTRGDSLKLKSMIRIHRVRIDKTSTCAERRLVGVTLDAAGIDANALYKLERCFLILIYSYLFLINELF